MERPAISIVKKVNGQDANIMTVQVNTRNSKLYIQYKIQVNLVTNKQC